MISMNSIRIFGAALTCLALSLFTYGQSMPGEAQQSPIAILGATAHLGTGEALENATIVFDKGKITYVGPAAGAAIPENAERIDARGRHVYPGFIAMDTRLGLLEIDAVRATNDTREVGYYNPNARTLIAFNTDSEVIPTVRNIGVLIAQVSPDGEGLAGQSSAMILDGWNWEDAALGTDEGMHLHWPSAYRQSGWWAEPGGTTKSESYSDDVQAVHHYFREAQAFAQNTKAEDNPRFRSMKRLFDKQQKLYVHARYAREIEDALAFAKTFGLDMVLVGATDAWLLTEAIAAAGVSVVCGEVHSLPHRSDDLLSQPFETPALLHKAGIPVAFSLSGAWEQRRLPHHAGHAVGFGLPYEEAVKGLTLTPARMMGIADRVGSLEVGKDATLFISEGDALDMRGNRLQKAWIGGRAVDLSSRQTKLADKYKAKYRRGE